VRPTAGSVPLVAVELAGINVGIDARAKRDSQFLFLARIRQGSVRRSYGIPPGLRVAPGTLEEPVGDPAADELEPANRTSQEEVRATR
jgi:hypothetical protein